MSRQGGRPSDGPERGEFAVAERSTTTPVEAAAPERDRLLATKLHVPGPRPGFLVRPRLLERLTEGTAGAFTLDCAPAGHEAHIRAGSVDKDVRLVETDDLNDQIDAAYRTKYRRYAASIIDTIVSPRARAATLRLVPTASYFDPRSTWPGCQGCRRGHQGGTARR
jgi:Uncharacterized protein conserved in bacteria (DUF2255)